MVHWLAQVVALTVATARGSFLDRGYSTQVTSSATNRRRRSDYAEAVQPQLQPQQGAKPQHGAQGGQEQPQPEPQSQHGPQSQHDLEQNQRGPAQQILDKNSERERVLRSTIWEGRDVPMDGFTITDLGGPRNVKSERNVQIFGLPNSGTSLLRALLFANFGARLTYYDAQVQPGQHDSALHNGLYRHSNFKILYTSEERVLQRIINEDILSIFVVRNPYSWLATMRAEAENNPFAKKEMSKCAKGDDWVFRACTYERPVGATAGPASEIYSSLSEIWNQWNDGYLRTGEFGITRRFVVTYENLVQKPQSVLASVMQFLGLRLTTRVVPFTAGPEVHQAQEIARSHSFMNFLDNKAKYQACHRLEPYTQSQLKFPRFTCEKFATDWNEKNAYSPIQYESEDQDLQEEHRDFFQGGGASFPGLDAIAPEDAGWSN